MTGFRHIRLWLAALLSLCSLLCAAESASNRPGELRDARKLRYEFKQQQAKDKDAPAPDKAETSSNTETAAKGDPAARGKEQPLSLLPDGAKPQKLIDSPPGDTPNQLPGMDNLTGGATVSRKLEASAKPASSGTIAAVRSMTRDGGGFGEERIVDTPVTPMVKPSTPPPVLAENPPAKGRPSLRGDDAAKPGGPKPLLIAKNAPAAAKPQSKPVQKPAAALPAAKPAAAAKQADGVAATQTAKAQPLSKPLATNLPDKREALTGGLPNKPAEEPSAAETVASAQAKPDFKWLNDDFYKQEASAETPVSELRTQTLAAEPELGIPDVVPRKSVADLQRSSLLAKGLFGAGAVFLVGLIFVALPKPRRLRTASDELAVIETIGLGDGRQLIIVQKRYYALVLGVTRQATHLLEKVAMSALDSNYRHTIQRIIERESEAPAGQWRMRPIFSSLYENSMPAFSDLSGEMRLTNIGELRQQLQVIGSRPVTHRTTASAAAPHLSRQQVKDQLRRRASENYVRAS